VVNAGSGSIELAMSLQSESKCSKISANVPLEFDTDIAICRARSVALRIIAWIEDPLVIEKILAHLGDKGDSARATRLPLCRTPPQVGFFDCYSANKWQNQRGCDTEASAGVVSRLPIVARRKNAPGSRPNWGAVIHADIVSRGRSNAAGCY